MLAQFQARYPTGCLISELLQIYQGKYIVRVAVQIEGLTRANGMAAAETLELAEDRARSRALMVLGIEASTSAEAARELPEPTKTEVQMPSVETASFLPMQAQASSSTTTAQLNDSGYAISLPSPQEESTTPVVAASPKVKGNDTYGKKSNNSNLSVSTPELDDDGFENFELKSSFQTESTGNPPISFGNVTPLVPRSSYEFEESANQLERTNAETQIAASQPVDYSDALAKTTVEIKRLGWSPQQGKDYLLRTYGKRSRQHLTDDEMLDFLHYLESQPSPSDPFA